MLSSSTSRTGLSLIPHSRSYSSINGDYDGSETIQERLEHLRREVEIREAARRARREARERNRAAAEAAELAELERRLAEYDLDSEDEMPAPVSTLLAGSNLEEDIRC